MLEALANEIAQAADAIVLMCKEVEIEHLGAADVEEIVVHGFAGRADLLGSLLQAVFLCVTMQDGLQVAADGQGSEEADPCDQLEQHGRDWPLFV